MNESSCVFCRIVAGTSPASVVYEGQRAVAFMDRQPVNPGHVLLVPRRHVAEMAELGAELGGHLFQVAMRLADAVRRADVRCEGINLYLADGQAAGQEVLHLHLHVLPRFSGDGFGLHLPPGYARPTSRAALDDVATSIRQALGASRR